MKRAILVGILSSACTQDVPATPSFQVDVLPVLAANCVRCHGYPATIPPPGDRFDSFENLVVGETFPNECGAAPGTVCGVSVRASTIAERVQPGFQGLVPSPDDDPGVMPPRFPLSDEQQETIARWAEQGAQRGTPRPDNQLPTMTVEPLGQTDRVVTLAVSVGDADRDLVVGELYAIVDGAQQFVGSLRSGHYELAWTTPKAGSFALVARLDDGAGFTEHMPGTVEVQ